MTWIRGSVGDVTQHLGSTLNAILIWLFAALALHYALGARFQNSSPLGIATVHRRKWVVVLPHRIFVTFLIFKGPIGFNPVTFTGPFLSFMAFAQYLAPLAFLEIYLRAQARPGAPRRMATAGMLFVLTLAMAAGLFAATMAIWVPDVKAGFDPRKSISETLSATIASSGLMPR